MEKKDAVQKEINDALGIIADHKEYIQTKLADLEEFANSHLLTEDVEFTTGAYELHWTKVDANSYWFFYFSVYLN